MEMERSRNQPARTQRDRSNVVVGSAWMVGLALLFFWLPAINGLLGGVVGGYKVGTLGRALAAAVLPAILVALGMWLLFAAFDLGGWGLLAGIGMGALIVFADLGIFIGAAIGGAVAQSQRGRRHATV